MRDDPIKPRRHARRRVALEASCRAGDGSAHEVELVNLSEGGCQMTVRGGRVASDQTVAVRPPSLESLPGVVRWSAGNSAGIEFAAPLYPAVVEHLSRDGVPSDPGTADGATSPPSGGVMGFTDNFGRPLPALGERRKRQR